ncbi:hypothetical protein ACOI1H_22350 [Loktanella sp. DJP18]|uniref:hypothetical protein n=1 Tax=Loktanella sp. DJP18 TaxID=3409788 RepID=UPI003BB4C8B5
MSITHDRPEGDVPWYLLRSSILMITMTILAIAGIALDHVTQADAPATGYRTFENRAVTQGGR